MDATIEKKNTFYCFYKAQQVREVENLERGLIETMKYGSKTFTGSDLNKKLKRLQNQ